MRLLILLFFCLLNVISYAQSKKALAPEIDGYMQSVAMKDGFTGTLVVKHHGQVVLQKGYGLANRESLAPNTPETIYNLGTAGAIFTEMSIMMLQEQKKLSLSDPICKYLHDCPSTWEKITIRHLLEQKSGLPNYIIRPEVEKELSKAFSKKEMLAKIAALPLEFSPGEKFNASSAGYYVIGVIIEKVSGTSLASFVRKNIFLPLGMNQSTLLEKGSLKNAARGYVVNGDSVQPAPFVDPSIMFGYGNLYGTAGDLLRWEAALYHNKILSSPSLQEIDNWVAAAGYGDKTQEMYGHAFRRYYKGTWGYRMHMLRFPADSTVIMILTNNNSTKQDKFMRDIATMIYSTYTPPVEIKEVLVSSSILQQYAGNYAFAPGREVAITVQNGRLHMQGTDRPRRELVAVSDTKFYIKGSEVFLEFRETGGVVNELTLHEINSTITAKRKK